MATNLRNKDKRNCDALSEHIEAGLCQQQTDRPIAKFFVNEKFYEFDLNNIAKYLAGSAET